MDNSHECSECDKKLDSEDNIHEVKLGFKYQFICDECFEHYTLDISYED